MSTLRPVRPQAHCAMVAVTLLLVAAPFAAAAPDGPVASSSSSTSKVLVVKEPIPYEVEKRPSTQLQPGTAQTVRPGKPGVKQVTYSVQKPDSIDGERKVIATKILKQPVNEILAVGRRGGLPSRGYFSGRKSFEMIATGYDPSPASNGGNTTGRSAIGLKIGHGVVAVDPKFIPLGTRLYIEGYGHAIAADTGGAIKGNRIDLGYETKRAADSVGRRKVIVHILD